MSVRDVGADRQLVCQRQDRRNGPIVPGQTVAIDPWTLPVLRQELPVGAGKLIDTLVRIADQRDLGSGLDELLEDCLVERTDVLRFIDQYVRIAPNQRPQYAWLRQQCAIAPISPKVMGIRSHLR
ncbi:hypothetical protein D3C87_1669650 [compost metagenome]